MPRAPCPVPRAPALLAPRPCASCRACRRPPWPYRERTGCRTVGVCYARTWPCHGLGRYTALPSVLLLVTIHHVVLRYSPCCQPFLGTIQAVYCDTTALPQLLSVTIHLVYRNTQPAHTSPANLQYTLVYCNTVPKPTSLNLCNIIGTLQYKKKKKKKFHNIVWAVAQKRFLHQIYFFFPFFISTHSNYWKILKKHLYTFFFLLFPHSNKFIKIYFPQLSFFQNTK